MEKAKFQASFDLVLLRNVLIYFVAADQEKVLRNIGLTVKKDSLLIIGESESISHLQTPFHYIAPPLCWVSSIFGDRLFPLSI